MRFSSTQFMQRDGKAAMSKHGRLPTLRRCAFPADNIVSEGFIQYHFLELQIYLSYNRTQGHGANANIIR